MAGHPTLVTFGHRVQQRRKSLSYSQEELAERTGFHRTYIGSIERGLRNPALLNLLRLADGLSMEPGDLISGLPTPRRPKSTS